MSGILANCVFVIDKSIPLKKKVELIKQIKSNGGASVYSVTPKATHLVTNPDNGDKSSKVDSARQLGIHVVSKEFVTECISQGAKLDEKQYEVSSEAINAPSSPNISSSTAPPRTPPVSSPTPLRSPSSHPSSPPAPSSPSFVARPPPGFKLPPSNSRSNNSNNHHQLPPTIGSPPREPRHHHPYANSYNHPHPAHTLTAVQAQQPAYSDDVSDQSSDGAPETPVMDLTGEMESGPEEYTHGDGADSTNEGHYTSPPRRQWRDDRYNKTDSSQYDDRASRSYRQGQHNSYPPRSSDDGCKIFVGGIMFDDLNALGKTKDGFTDSPDVISHIQKMKHERLVEIIKIFNKFGAITRVQQFVDDRHIFISYDDERSAVTAVSELKSLEVRKKIVQDIRERLRAEGRQTIIAPRINFYVRWPNRIRGSQSESERYSGRSDSEGSWRRSSLVQSDNDQGYSSSAFSESESDQHFSTRYLHPNHRHASPSTKRYDSDSASDTGPRQEIRARRIVAVPPPQIVSSQASSSTSATLVPYAHTLPPSMYPASTLPPSIIMDDAGRVDWLWIWSKVIILLQVAAIITIVYFYNKGGF